MRPPAGGKPWISIGQAAARTGLSVHTLRFYEKEGLLPFLQRRPSGTRAFSQEDLTLLQWIVSLKETGVSLREIRQLLAWHMAGEEQCLRAFYQAQTARIEEQIAALEGHRVRIQAAAQTYSRDGLRVLEDES